VDNIQDIVDRYIDTWNETDAQRRHKLIAEVYTEDAGYTDPLVAVRGRDAIDQFVATAQQQFPGMVFTLGSPVDAHHNQARFSWHLGVPGGEEPVVVGFDVAVVEDGRLREVYGFLDKVPVAQ
jgi:hypothetical protein